MKFVVTCWPSMLICEYPCRISGAPVDWFCRLPGASMARSVQLRPLSGSSCICRGSMLPPSVEEVTSMSGASPVTVTDSCTVERASSKLMTACCPSSSSRPVRVTVANPVSARRDAVGPRPHGDPVRTGLVGDRLERVPGGFVSRGDGDAGQHGHRRVPRGSADHRFLRVADRRQRHDETDCRQTANTAPIARVLHAHPPSRTDRSLGQGWGREVDKGCLRRDHCGSPVTRPADFRTVTALAPSPPPSC